MKFSSNQWNENKTFTYTVKVVNPAKAKLQLKNKSLTLYNYGSEIKNSISTVLGLAGENMALDLLKDVQIAPADKNTTAAFGNTLSVTYDQWTGEVKAKSIGDGPNKGTYKVNLILQNDLFKKALKETLTIKVVKVNDLSKCVSVKAAGKIDVLNRDGTSMTLTPKFANLGTNMEVKGYTLTGADAHLFDVQKILNHVMTIRLKDNVHIITKYDYKVSVAYEIQSGDDTFTVTSAPVKIKLTQGSVKVKINGANIFSNTVEESKDLNFVVTNSMGEKLSIENVKLLNYTKDFAYEYDAENQTGVLKHQLKGQTARGKSYTLKFELYLKDRGDNEKPVNVSFKVQIVK